MSGGLRVVLRWFEWWFEGWLGGGLRVVLGLFEWWFEGGFKVVRVVVWVVVLGFWLMVWGWFGWWFAGGLRVVWW